MLYHYLSCRSGLNSRWAIHAHQDAGIGLTANYLFIMFYSAMLLSLLAPGQNQPDRPILFDLKRIVFTLSIEWSNWLARLAHHTRPDLGSVRRSEADLPGPMFISARIRPTGFLRQHILARPVGHNWIEYRYGPSWWYLGPHISEKITMKILTKEADVVAYCCG